MTKTILSRRAGFEKMPAQNRLPASDSRVKRLTSAINQFQRRPDALIEVLHTAQDLFGYLAPEVLKFVASEMKVPASRVYGVVTFYHFFSLKRKGEYSCLVCTGTACHVKGAEKLLESIRKEFDLKPGHTTPDGRLGLETARCLGCCGLAPAAVLNNEVVANANPEMLVERIREAMGVAHGR